MGQFPTQAACRAPDMQRQLLPLLLRLQVDRLQGVRSGAV